MKMLLERDDQGEYIVLQNLPSNRVSFSQLTTYLTCPEKWYLQYVKKLTRQSNSALILGSGIHSALKVSNAAVARGNPRPMIAEACAYFRNALQLEYIKSTKNGMDIEWKNDDTMPTLVDDGVKMLECYESKVGIHLRPVAVEEQLLFPLEGTDYEVLGYLDNWDEDHKIIDTKTTDKRKDLMDPFTTTQFDTYQVGMEAMQRPVSGFEMHVILRPNAKGESDIQILSAPKRTPERLARHVENMVNAVTAMRTYNTYRVDDWFKCNWCAFLKSCHPEWFAKKIEVDLLKAQEKEQKRLAKEAEKAEKGKNKKSNRKPAAAAGRV